jgi:anti-sigma regulatory factor (Ser/Thr protein kinase)
MNKTYELKLKSHIGEVRRVERFVKKMAAELGFAQSRLHDIMLVITEATNNAILHGNKLIAPNWLGYAVRFVVMSYM